MIESKNIQTIASEGYADDALVELAKKGYVIATLDAELKKRLKKEGAKILTLRQKKYVVEG